MDEDLVERTQIRNRQGRGRVFHLSIKHTPKTKRLLAAINKATANKKRRSRWLRPASEITAN
jgi:hypothetical protein